MKKLFWIVGVVVALFFGNIILHGLYSDHLKVTEPDQKTIATNDIESARTIEQSIIDRINQDRQHLSILVENECLSEQARRKAQQIADNQTTEDGERTFDYKNYILDCFNKNTPSVSGKTTTAGNVRTSNGLYDFIKLKDEKILFNKDFTEIGVGCYSYEATGLNTCLVFLFGDASSS